MMKKYLLLKKKKKKKKNEFKTMLQTSIPYLKLPKPRRLKTISFGAAHTYLAHIGEYPRNALYDLFFVKKA